MNQNRHPEDTQWDLDVRAVLAALHANISVVQITPSLGRHLADAAMAAADMIAEQREKRLKEGQ